MSLLFYLCWPVLLLLHEHFSLCYKHILVIYAQKGFSVCGTQSHAHSPPRLCTTWSSGHHRACGSPYRKVRRSLLIAAVACLLWAGDKWPLSRCGSGLPWSFSSGTTTRLVLLGLLWQTCHAGASSTVREVRLHHRGWSPVRAGIWACLYALTRGV